MSERLTLEGVLEQVNTLLSGCGATPPFVPVLTPAQAEDWKRVYPGKPFRVYEEVQQCPQRQRA